MKSIDVLMPSPMTALITKGVDAAFRVHKLWEAADPKTKLKEIDAVLEGQKNHR